MMRSDEASVPLMREKDDSPSHSASSSPRIGPDWRNELPSDMRASHVLSRLSFRMIRIFHRSSTRLITSFVRPESSPTTHSAPSERISRTEWLNGIRGFAALFVFFHHFQYPYHDPTRSSTGYMGGAPGTELENRWVPQMPFIRLLHSGNTMIAVFYIVSGFSLSIKPVALIREQNWEKLLFCLASSTWRRAGRLYLPCLVITLVAGALGTQLGLYEFAREAMKDKLSVPGWTDPQPERFPSLGLQLADWFWHMSAWARPFVIERAYVKYDNHLWTIPVEYRCSLMLFATILGLARMRVSVRICSQIALILYCAFGNSKWEMVLFYVGFLFAELDAIKLDRYSRLKNLQLLQSQPHWTLARIAWLFVAVFGMFLMSSPDLYYSTTPGYVTLHSMVPLHVRDRERYVPIFGSILFMMSVLNVAQLRRLFSTSVARYLGRVSFMLYVVQHPMNQIFGYRIVLGIRHLMGGLEDGFIHKEVAFFVALAVYTPICLLIADVLTKTVDAKCLDFMRWAEGKCSALISEGRGNGREIEQRDIGLSLRSPV